MCERGLFRALEKNHTDLSKFNGEYYLVANKIQMKMKILDTKVITGPMNIERHKNLSAQYYQIEETPDKVTYKKKQKHIMGKDIGIDFEVLMKERKPQGINTGFSNQQNEKQTDEEEKDQVSIIQLDIQFSSNLRIGIRHKDDKTLTIGAPLEFYKEYENHVLRFERYYKLPLELRVLRDKMQKEAMHDPKKFQQLRDEELLNPWIITDLDFSLDGNPFVK